MQEKVRALAEEMSKLYLMPFKVEEGSVDADMYKMITFLESRIKAEVIEMGIRQRKGEKQRTQITESLTRLSPTSGRIRN